MAGGDNNSQKVSHEIYINALRVWFEMYIDPKVNHAEPPAQGHNARFVNSAKRSHRSHLGDSML